MSFHSPITPQTGSLRATVPPAETVAQRGSADADQSLAWWGVVIDEKLRAVRRTLAVKLASMEPGERDCAPSRYAEVLAECDAIEASVARLIIPPRPAGDSFLGHLVAELEAAVALADREARIAALAAHKARLEELIVASGENEACLKTSTD